MFFFCFSSPKRFTLQLRDSRILVTVKKENVRSGIKLLNVTKTAIFWLHCGEVISWQRTQMTIAIAWIYLDKYGGIGWKRRLTGVDNYNLKEGLDDRGKRLVDVLLGVKRTMKNVTPVGWCARKEWVVWAPFNYVGWAHFLPEYTHTLTGPAPAPLAPRLEVIQAYESTVTRNMPCYDEAVMLSRQQFENFQTTEELIQAALRAHRDRQMIGQAMEGQAPHGQPTVLFQVGFAPYPGGGNDPLPIPFEVQVAQDHGQLDGMQDKYQDLQEELGDYHYQDRDDMEEEDQEDHPEMSDGGDK